MLLHLSHAADSSDGGIAFAVTDLLKAQRDAGLKAQWLTAEQFGPLRRDFRLLSTVRAQPPEIVHVHGLWRSPTRIAPLLARDGLPIVLAPHGMLDPWALAISNWKKQPVMRLWEMRALQSSTCIQALCHSEAEAIRLIHPNAPIATIPNGVALPDLEAEPLSPPPWAGLIPQGEKILLFFGRFHSKKGIQVLLEAWEEIAAEAGRAGWWLVFVGYGDRSFFQRQSTLNPIPRCLVFDPVFGPLKSVTLAASSAFILPSFSEGLPMAALESMAHGLPCLLSSACNIPQAFAARAALPTEPQRETLITSLIQLFSRDRAALASIGQAARTFVSTAHDPAITAARTIELYRWILDGGPTPAFVEL